MRERERNGGEGGRGTLAAITRFNKCVTTSSHVDMSHWWAGLGRSRGPNWYSSANFHRYFFLLVEGDSTIQVRSAWSETIDYYRVGKPPLYNFIVCFFLLAPSLSSESERWDADAADRSDASSKTSASSWQHPTASNWLPSVPRCTGCWAVRPTASTCPNRFLVVLPIVPLFYQDIYRYQDFYHETHICLPPNYIELISITVLHVMFRYHCELLALSH